ncbi:hypothetical protein ACI2LF_29185 [Kribbella sp. NPDC020789]
MNVRPTPVPRPDNAQRLAEQRDRRADEREAALDERERALAVRESAHETPDRRTQAILEAAAERDELADERDEEAGVRDQAASLESFLRDADYIPGHRARLWAGADRADSKDDRTSAATDRRNLTHTPHN